MNASPPRVSYPGISSEAYEHPLAQAALSTVRKAKGFDLVLKKAVGTTTEAIVRMHHLASAVKVGDTQFRRLHAVMTEAVHTMDVADPPQLYVNRSVGFNAMTIGFDKPFIVLGSDLIDDMSDDEVRFVIGHELGHAMSGHALYESLAWFLASVGASGLSGVPGGALVVKGIELALQDWARKSELSGDRAGLLVGQDLEVAVRTLMKLAGGKQTEEMNPRAFLEQAAEFEDGTTGLRNRIVKWLMPSSDHPLLVVRAAELDRWVRDGEYGRIVHEGDYPLRGESASVSGKVIQGLNDARRRTSLDAGSGTAVGRLGRLGRQTGARGLFDGLPKD